MVSFNPSHSSQQRVRRPIRFSPLPPPTGPNSGVAAARSSQEQYGAIIPLSQLVRSSPSAGEAIAFQPSVTIHVQQMSTAFQQPRQFPSVNNEDELSQWQHISSYTDHFQGFQTRSPPALSPEASTSFYDNASLTSPSAVQQDFHTFISQPRQQQVRTIQDEQTNGDQLDSTPQWPQLEPNRRSTLRTLELSQYLDSQLQQYRNRLTAADQSIRHAQHVLFQSHPPEHTQIPPRLASTAPPPPIISKFACGTRSNSLKERSVYLLHCVCCRHVISFRGMRALLLANKKRTLYSTDMPLLQYPIRYVCLFIVT